ncbi:MAG: GumC family protein [Sphingosinicella sp.]|uniref:GumC family protein n=1 Tax=Sphingosinicella sp. TaxID=1917971 RepID=UPI0040383863
MNDLATNLADSPRGRDAGHDDFVEGVRPDAREGLLGHGEPTESIIRHYWRVLLKRRWVILAVVIISALIGLTSAMLSQRLYSATVTVEIARQADRIINVEEVQPRPGADQEFYQTQYALLRSRSLAEMVVRDLRLAHNIAFLTDFTNEADSEIANFSLQQREAMAVARVMGNVQIIPVRLSSVVNVRFVSPNPQMAADIANSLAENYIEQNLARRFGASAYARQFLEGRLSQMRQRLEQSERQAVNYAAQQEIINIAPSSRDPQAPAQEQSLVAANLAAVNLALSEAQAARIAAEARFRQAANGAAQADALANPALNTLRQQRATASADYQSELSIRGPDYPTVLVKSAQVRELDRQIAAETSRVHRSVEQNLQAQFRQAQQAERELSGRVNELKGEVIGLRRRSIQYNIYQREVDTNRALYDALLQRYKEIGIAGVGSNNVSIVDPAIVPGGPFRPNVPLNLLVSLLIGMVLGGGAALVLEQLDEATIAPADFENKLGLALLGTVPKFGKDADVREMLGDSKAIISEAYRSVLTGLQFSTAHGLPRSLLLTSTQPSEGKSTSAYALALGIARVGSRVLIVDADMRNPSLHKLMGLSNQGGLSNLLTGDGELMKLARETGVPNLYALPAGPIPPNPAELLAGTGMKDLLIAAGEQFDHVVVDGPPVLGLADAPLLARSVEATVFVLQAGSVRATQARHALNRLLTVHAPIAGAVLTKFDQQSAGYGYGYGYDYNYGS